MNLVAKDKAEGRIQPRVDRGRPCSQTATAVRLGVDVTLHEAVGETYITA